jgi:hypothetical protein
MTFTFQYFFFFFREIQVPLKCDKNNGTLYEEQYAFTLASRSDFPIMRNVSDISCRENQNKHSVVIYFFSEIVPLVR